MTTPTPYQNVGPTTTAAAMREPFRFFFEHAGYVVGRRAAGAWNLARAERDLLVAIDHDRARVLWEDDVGPFDNAGTAEWIAAAPGNRSYLGCVVERRCECCGEWRHADSLWGIALDVTTFEDNLPGDPYARVIRAEVAAEAGFGV